jgi:hypothetical protein
MNFLALIFFMLFGSSVAVNLRVNGKSNNGNGGGKPNKTAGPSAAPTEAPTNSPLSVPPCHQWVCEEEEAISCEMFRWSPCNVTSGCPENWATVATFPGDCLVY